MLLTTLWSESLIFPYLNIAHICETKSDKERFWQACKEWWFTRSKKTEVG